MNRVCRSRRTIKLGMQVREKRGEKNQKKKRKERERIYLP